MRYFSSTGLSLQQWCCVGCWAWRRHGLFARLPNVQGKQLLSTMMTMKNLSRRGAYSNEAKALQQKQLAAGSPRVWRSRSDISTTDETLPNIRYRNFDPSFSSFSFASSLAHPEKEIWPRINDLSFGRYDPFGRMHVRYLNEEEEHNPRRIMRASGLFIINGAHAWMQLSARTRALTSSHTTHPANSTPATPIRNEPINQTQLRPSPAPQTAPRCRHDRPRPCGPRSGGRRPCTRSP